MTTEISIGDINELGAVSDAGIHVNETEEIQAERRSETTKKHADEKQRVIVSLVVWRDVVDIEKLKKIKNLALEPSYLDLKKRPISTKTQVRNRNKAKQLQIKIIFHRSPMTNKNRENTQSRILQRKSAFRPNHHRREKRE